jgi:phage regulator Rha-like protein
MAEIEKVVGKKQDNISRAIKEITQELNITNPMLLY